RVKFNPVLFVCELNEEVVYVQNDDPNIETPSSMDAKLDLKSPLSIFHFAFLLLVNFISEQIINLANEKNMKQEIQHDCNMIIINEEEEQEEPAILWEQIDDVWTGRKTTETARKNDT
ncbi:hypothetical protein ACJX0J_014127, partial [Zea mays]